MVKFSFILPVRNGGAYVKLCINSILSQTLKDFNLIVLDNCSTDGTLEWIRSLDNERIIIYPATKPLSIEENWARIVDVPKNEFMTCIGHDDLFSPDYLQIMNDLVYEFPNASLYHAHFSYIDADGQLIRKCTPMQSQYSGADFLTAILTNSINIMGTGYMTRSVDYDAVGGIPAYTSLLFADFELWFRLAAIRSMSIAKQDCISFRLHQSTTGSAPDARMQQAFEEFINFLSELQHQDKLYGKVINENISRFLLTNCQALSHRLLRTPYKRRKPLTVERFVSKTKEYYSKFNSAIPYEPGKKKSIKLAIFIDNNALLRAGFLLFKKLYNKPVFKS